MFLHIHDENPVPYETQCPVCVRNDPTYPGYVEENPQIVLGGQDG